MWYNYNSKIIQISKSIFKYLRALRVDKCLNNKPCGRNKSPLLAV